MKDIKRSSWHYKLARSSGYYEWMDDSCSYIKHVLLGFCVTLVLCIVCIAITSVMVVYPIIYLFASIQYGFSEPDEAVIAAMFIWFIILVAGIICLLNHYVTNSRHTTISNFIYNIDTKIKSLFLFSVYKHLKDKYCVRINIID